MNNPHACPEESRILAATAIGSTLDESIRRHLESCSTCRDARGLAENLRVLANRHIAAPPPDPHVIWVMAQLSKPHSPWTLETIGSVAALAAVALLAIWIWPVLVAYLSGIVPNSDTAKLFLTSCVVAAAIAGAAGRVIHRLTGE